MKSTALKGLSVLLLSSLLAGCQSTETKEVENTPEAETKAVNNESSKSEHNHSQLGILKIVKYKIAHFLIGRVIGNLCTHIY